MRRHFILAAAACAAASACGGDTGPIMGDPPLIGVSLQIVNATRAPLNISVDGVRIATNIGVGVLSTNEIEAGKPHTVRLEATGALAKEFSVTPAWPVAVTAVVQAGIEGELIPSVLADTAATPAAGKTKLRVIHMAGTAPPIDFWRTRPDFATPTRVMFPFPYMAESSYIQSDAGTWTVFITSTSDSTTKLADSGPINVSGGEVVTVVLVDSAGVLKLRHTVDR